MDEKMKERFTKEGAAEEAKDAGCCGSAGSKTAADAKKEKFQEAMKMMQSWCKDQMPEMFEFFSESCCADEKKAEKKCCG